MSENETVAGQQKKADPALCGDCIEWFKLEKCNNDKSDRTGGRVDIKAAACKLFKHNSLILTEYIERIAAIAATRPDLNVTAG